MGFAELHSQHTPRVEPAGMSSSPRSPEGGGAARHAASTGRGGPMPLKMLDRRLRFDLKVGRAGWARYLPEDLRPGWLQESEPQANEAAGTPAPSGVCVGRVAGLEEAALGLVQVTGRVRHLSFNPRGSRQVQAAFDAVGSDGERVALARELVGHVDRAARCPHANHVLQKVVAGLQPKAVQFVIDELMEASVGKVARDKYGCRTVQRVIERCPEEQVADMVAELLAESNSLCRHAYGNYVMQNLLEHGAERHRQVLLGSLCEGVRTLGVVPAGCAVIATALKHTDEDNALRLASAVLKEPDVMLAMAAQRHGGLAVTRVLEVLRGPMRNAAINIVASESQALMASRHGIEVVRYIELQAACAGA
uniref:PUM-HD domain-containing protein n=1 Tax=Zooxanthella nutricula TaxID=1333877 RepID=A0A7S2P417_9DINO